MQNIQGNKTMPPVWSKSGKVKPEGTALLCCYFNMLFSSATNLYIGVDYFF